MVLQTSGPADLREALFNDCAVGRIQDIQVPLERITTLHGILFDLDPGLLDPDNALFPPADDPRAFHEAIRPVLDRHPLARSAEVRASGTGLHLLLWLDPAVELDDAGGQRRWAAVVRVLQRTLPVDPDMPGITAVTRPVGSTNGKNGAAVALLRPGEPVRPAAVEEYMERVARAPFREVALPLLGRDRVEPCPVCRGPRTRLDVLDYVGRCYNGCSKVTLDQLYDAIFKPLEPAGLCEGPALQGLLAGQVGQN